MSRIELIAHRGVHSSAPENSLAAVLAALDAGADGVELDLHRTADGAVVVHHDGVVRNLATSELAASREISGLGLADLRTFPLEDGSPIPVLSDVLRAVGRRAHMYLEIKAPNMEELVIECIKQERARASVHSFDHRIVRRCGELEPAVPRGVLLDSYLIDTTAAMRAAAATDLWQFAQHVDSELIREVHEVGGRVIAWTVNDAAEALRLARLGVDGICSDNVQGVRGALERG